MQSILIIEDNPNINNMIFEYLQENNYACTQAFSGTEGALRFQMEHFDLILLDLMLPGQTGEELIHTFAGKVPVIVLSAKNELDSKVELLSVSPLTCGSFSCVSRSSFAARRPLTPIVSFIIRSGHWTRRHRR